MYAKTCVTETLATRILLYGKTIEREIFERAFQMREEEEREGGTEI